MKASPFHGLRWMALLAVAVPPAVLFGPALIADRSLAMRDAAHFYYPLFEWCSQEWAAGRAPLWNPNESCGVPVLADGTSSVFYPGKLLFILPLDFALLFKLYVVGHVLLAAAGSYLVARSWNATRAAAAAAAMSYSCGGHVVFQYCNVPFLVGAAWLPFAAFAADGAIRSRSWRGTTLLGLVLALMVLGGDPQMAYHVLLACALYAGLLALRRNVHVVRDLDDWQERWTGRFRSLFWDRGMHAALAARFGVIVFAAVVAGLLAAVQVLPTTEATEFSERAAFNRPRNIYEATLVAMQPASIVQPFGETKVDSIVHGLCSQAEPSSHDDFIYDFSVGPWRLIEYIWPNVSGQMFPTHRRWLSALPAEGRVWTPTLYLGLLPALFGLAALRVRVGTVREQWLSWLVLVFTLASFGVYGIGWLVHEVHGWLPERLHSPLSLGLPVGGLYWLMVVLLPYYVYFRYPAKVLPLVAFGLSQLAAVGWDHAVLVPRPKLAKLLACLGIGSAALAIIVACLEPGLVAHRIPADPILGPFDGTQAHRDVFLAFTQTAIVCLAALWLLRTAWRQPEKRNQCQGMMLLLTAVELAAANAWLVFTAPTELWRSESPIAAAIRDDTNYRMPSIQLPQRVFRGNLAGWRPGSFAKESSSQRPAELAKWQHDTLFPKFHLPSDISLVESYNSIKLIDYEALLDVARRHGPRQPDKSNLPQPTALRLLGTDFLVLPELHEPAFAERTSKNGAQGWPENAALWHMTRTLPRAWVVNHVESFAPLKNPRIESIQERTKAVLFPDGVARDFAKTAVVETDQPLMWSEKGMPGTPQRIDECRITLYEPQRVVIEATLWSPGLLVLSDAWFAGWKAVVTTDGESRDAPIHRTNRVCRGVWLPEGSHTVEFKYQPESVRRGAIVSAVSWSLFGIVGLIALITGRRRR